MHITTTSAGTHTTAKRWLSVALWMVCLHCTNSMAQEAAPLPLAAESSASEQMTASPVDAPAQPTQQASPDPQQHKGSSHASAVPYIHEGMNYYYARRMILKNGWKPIRVSSDSGGEDFPPEVDACSNTNNCNIYFYKGRRMLAIMTYGDYFPHFNSRLVSRKDRKQYPVVVWFKIFVRIPILHDGMAYADARQEALALGWKLTSIGQKKEQQKQYKENCPNVPNPPSVCSMRNSVAEIGSCWLAYHDKPGLYHCRISFRHSGEWLDIDAAGNLTDINTRGKASRLRINDWFYSK